MDTLKAYLDGRRKGEFAERIGIAPSYLSQILSGHRRPPYDLMCRIEDETDGAVTLYDWREASPENAGAS